MAQSNLNDAKKNKNDEFYTQLCDIEKELCNYKEQFRGKTVLCNCDDPYESNFFKYFAMNFNYLGLKKLIATCYVSSPVMYTQLALFDDMQQTFERPADPNKKPYKVEITEVKDLTGNGAIDLDDIQLLLKNHKNVCSVLEGDGDFRSEECIELLKEADIVVTNPPFSLFREYVAQLIKYEKKFLIIGNINAVTYKELFPFIRDNKIWWGISTNGSNRYFRVPDSYPLTEKTGKIEGGVKYAFVKGVMWYTNLKQNKRDEEIILWKKYTAEEYPRYINYDAIDVCKVNEIPADYFGEMGVPITFLNKYNPNQFEIIGISLELAKPMSGIVSKGTYMPGGNRFYTERTTESDLAKGYKYHREYDRIVIRRKEQPT